MDNTTYKEIKRLLIQKGYLQRRGLFTFSRSEECPIEDYNDDLYHCNRTNIQRVQIYWGQIRRRNICYEVYLTEVSVNERVLTVINNGIIEFQKKI